MKICLYSPYVPKHVGGGEKYFFDAASALAQHHEVTIALPQRCTRAEIEQSQQKYEQFLERSMENITFSVAPLHNGTVLQKLLWTRKFDLCFAVTDGSAFFSASKKNVLHIQVPFTQPKHRFLERLKLDNWKIKNANSAFTQRVVENAWNTKIQYVHYPAIDDNCFQQISKKEKVIINVGRFFRQLHSKRQDIIVQAFSKLRKEHPELSNGWKLVLIGTVEDESYAQEVKKLAVGQPIEFYHHLNRKELLRWYQRASIYWHAAGFEVNETEHPERVEHFGISTAEAMAAGCIPVVVGKGGQVEVLGTQLQHLQWQTMKECCQITSKLLEPAAITQELQQQCVTQAKTFSSARFQQTLYEMIS